MVWLQITAVVIGVIILILAIIFWIITRKSEKNINVLPNSSFIEIDKSRIRFTSSHELGIIKKMFLRKNKTWYIEFYPTDVVQGENVERPEIQRLIVAKEFLKQRDTVRRRRFITIARSLADIPEELRNTQIGKELAEEGQNAFIEKAFSDAIPSGDERVREIIVKSHRGLGKVEINTAIDNARASSNIANAGNSRQNPNQ